MTKTRKSYWAGVILSGITASLAGGNAVAGGFLDVDFDQVTFSTPLMIDNPYWPLNPDGASRTFTYEAETEDGCVLNKLYINGGPPGGPIAGTKMLTGAYASLGEVLEVADVEWVDEECDGNFVETEVTLDWYAQDDFGNIWYMGELSRNFEDECEEGEFDPSTPTNTEDECYEGSWEAGITAGEGDEAVTGEPGIVVPSDMPLGASGEPLAAGTYYMQEVAFEAQDMAKILRLHAPLSVDDGVAPGEYDNCRKVKEWNPFEHGGSVEHKWYCHDTEQDYGPGLVLTEGVGGGPTEVETLVEIDPAF
jgi:hypothetical protein